MKTRDVVLRQVAEGRVEGAVEIVDRIVVERDMVILVSRELVLPRARATHRQVAAGEKIVLVRVLVGIRGQFRRAVKPPVRRNACPGVVVAHAQAERHTVGDLHPKLPPCSEFEYWLLMPCPLVLNWSAKAL